MNIHIIQSLELRDKIIADQNEALASAHAALLHARKAAEWYAALGFEWGGRPLAEVIDEAIEEIRNSR